MIVWCVVSIDQKFIGCMFCFNVVIYIGFFDYVWCWFVEMLEVWICGYKFGWFFFNVVGGCCLICEGEGFVMVELFFLFLVYIVCFDCYGICY